MSPIIGQVFKKKLVKNGQKGHDLSNQKEQKVNKNFLT